jgi:hypothetical protein
MARYIRIASVILLFINGVTAVAGGLLLVLSPEGQLAGMSPERLAATAFKNYLFPGLTLLVGIGFFSIYTAILFITRYQYSPVFLILEGFFLAAWTLVQVLAFSKLSFLQPVYGLTALIMLLFGFLLSTSFKLKADLR